MIRKARIIGMLFFCLGLMFERSLSQWKRTASVLGVHSVIKFFNDQFGLIGNGASPGSRIISAHAIFRSTDGGFSWTETMIPAQEMGEITDFYMIDTFNGFASVINYPGSTTSGLWRTTDAGLTWQNTSFMGSGTSVYKTSKGLIVTDLFQNNQISTDNGISWSLLADGGKNDVSFATDLFGVSSTYRGGDWRVTFDGGLTWTAINQPNESWSVFMSKNGLIMATPEGNSDGSNPQPSSLIISRDTGLTWQTFLLPPYRTTGHIGVINEKIIVIQEQSGSRSPSGFYLSTDQGVTWNAIGGATGYGDTRFSLLHACGKGIIYSFDQEDNSILRYEFPIGDDTIRQAKISVITSDQTTDTIGGIVYVPITFSGLDSTEDISIIMHYDTNLTYLGAFSPTGISLDVPNKIGSGVTELQIKKASNGILSGYATFSVFPNPTPLKVIFDSPTGNITDCIRSIEQHTATITPPAGCGYGMVASFMKTGNITTFSILPNPVSETMQIRLSHKLDEFRYKLYNDLGTLQKSGSATGISAECEVKNLVSGNYYLQIINRDNSVVGTAHFIINH